MTEINGVFGDLEHCKMKNIRLDRIYTQQRADWRVFAAV
jgi:hypothetical protein